ncbi:hypothetical protein ACR79N_18535 [Sphingobacterium siyangense]|uniref:hypothetical protein n=1 Tax=Sphingobacterium TaxID=28453 RepID=UPI000E988738|nr:hypothetical protein [Sphingobacterium sp.]HBI88868.1 hypothetical protein [Sphingobacterium sp.]
MSFLLDQNSLKKLLKTKLEPPIEDIRSRLFNLLNSFLTFEVHFIKYASLSFGLQHVKMQYSLKKRNEGS